MEPLIFYPTFEPPSDTWLKFSLLYFENFRPIVPYNRRHLISDTFRRIQSETDLVSLYAPDYEEGHRASLKAIEEVDKILSATYERSPLFNQINILRKWNTPSNWSFLVYGEKFSDNWAYYCEQNKIGKRTNDGILLPEELAFLFMTYLAKEIAFKESAAIITDNNKFDNYTNYSRASYPMVNRKSRFAKGIINLLVPKNLTDISFTKLIEFRNRNRELIKVFNQELNNIQQKIGNGYSEHDFIESYNNIYSEFSREIILQGIGIASIPFAAYILLESQQATTPEYVREILGALGIVLGGMYSLHKGLQETSTKRYCKKYLTNLERLR